MQGFYNVTTKIREELEKDEFCKTVTYGDIFNVDLKKQTIFPLSHFMVNNATLNGNIWTFSFSLLCMDLVDKVKDYAEGDPDYFEGVENEQDVWNTQLAVANRVLEMLRRGDLYDELFQLDGQPSCQPFVDRFENDLAGWTVDFTIMIPNGMTICAN
ncbi:MAG: hypothetical protein KAS30_01825 [Candidatus Diapherotrites archaeon]|nr:hypothetical protein [Candidatus Diapherotrites archaeon]QDP50809.1 MAG: hypothetical protein GOVbin2181_51 [Prokaryotic dsDNA virus sp.]|tara:strand:+ start:686 stop:1156 length:471 start_codon:yes stop_codon:yes gene_type:complete